MRVSPAAGSVPRGSGIPSGKYDECVWIVPHEAVDGHCGQPIGVLHGRRSEAVGVLSCAICILGLPHVRHRNKQAGSGPTCVEGELCFRCHARVSMRVVGIARIEDSIYKLLDVPVAKGVASHVGSMTVRVVEMRDPCPHRPYPISVAPRTRTLEEVVVTADCRTRVESSVGDTNNLPFAGQRYRGS